MNPLKRVKYLIMLRDLLITKAQVNFWEFCKLRQPKFYKEDRHYLQVLCETLQALFEKRIIRFPKKNEDDEPEPWRIISKEEKEEIDDKGLEYEVCRKIIINMPRRFGKSRTVELFTEWVLGRDFEMKIISVSYNSILSGLFARYVRDDIVATKEDELMTVYHDIFPNTNIKYGDSGYQKWSLEGQFFTYLATSFNATITGIGCNLGIVDDPVKTHEEAFNLNKLDNQYDWYTNTYLQTLEEDSIEVIPMTRWATHDLTGRLIEDEPGQWYVLVFEAKNRETGEMLCEEVMSSKTYDRKKALMDSIIFDANYHQEPVDLKGTVYTRFKLYDIKRVAEEGIEYIVLWDVITGADIVRVSNEKNNKTIFDLFDDIISYTDTADEGDDYLATGIAGVFKGQLYLLAVIYTSKPMEITESLVARKLYENRVNRAKIESNKGGKAFSRMVKLLLWTNHKSRDTNIEWFHQAANKMSRILTNSTWVMQNIFYPANWRKRWPKFYESMTRFQKEGENQHDDAQDMITGLAEMIRATPVVSDDDVESMEEYLEEQYNSMGG